MLSLNKVSASFHQQICVSLQSSCEGEEKRTWGDWLNKMYASDTPHLFQVSRAAARAKMELDVPHEVSAPRLAVEEASPR